jgi:hypothetical protein
LSVHGENVRMILMPTREGADAMRAQEPFLIEHPSEHTAEFVLVQDRQQESATLAGLSGGSDVGDEVGVTFAESVNLVQEIGEAEEEFG